MLTTTTLGAAYDLGTIDVVPASDTSVVSTVAPTALSPEAAQVLGLVFDEPCRALVAAALAAGCPMPVAGFEPEGAGGAHGWMVEVAWPDAKVALLADADEARDDYLHRGGWRAAHHTNWTTEGLIAALKETT